MNTRFLTGRPLPLQVPTAFVRIRPTSATGTRARSAITISRRRSNRSDSTPAIGEATAKAPVCTTPPTGRCTPPRPWAATAPSWTAQPWTASPPDCTLVGGWSRVG